MPQALADQVALVTGASSGIGAATAAALAAAGVTVYVVARRKDRLAELVRKIEASGGNAVALPGDVTDKAFAVGAVERAIKLAGRLDILVNSAGVIQADSFDSADLDQWQRTINVNLMGTLYTCAAAVPTMKARGSGFIVNIGSLACRTTSPIYNSYATSKNALFAMTDGLRKEVGPSGVRVCMLAPGTVKTEVAEAITDGEHRKAIREYLHQDGMLESEDIANTIVFLVSQPPRVNISEIYVRATTDILY